jgi:predicted Fe-Mo cluster-binding NifX family protein
MTPRSGSRSGTSGRHRRASSAADLADTAKERKGDHHHFLGWGTGVQGEVSQGLDILSALNHRVCTLVTHGGCAAAAKDGNARSRTTSPGIAPGYSLSRRNPMIVCVPVTKEGMIDPRWGRADWLALAEVLNGEIVSWQEVEVSWSRLHDEGTPGTHHARVVSFLREHQVEAVVANHIGDGMVRMLDTMRMPVHLGAAGDARAAVLAAAGR